MKNLTKKTIQIYWQHAKRYRLWLAGIIISIVLVSGLDAYTSILYKDFFNTITSGGVPELLVKSLVGILLLILVVNIAHTFFWRLVSWLSSKSQSQLMADLYNTCFAYLHKNSFDFFNASFTGAIVKKVNRFVRGFEEIADQITFNISLLIFSSIFVLLVLFSINIWLFVGLLVWMLIFMFFNTLFVRYKLKNDLKLNAVDSELTGALADTITNNVNVKLFNGYARECENFGAINEKRRKLQLFSWVMGGVWYEGVQGIFCVILEFVIFYGAVKLWQKNLLTPGDFVLIQSYLIVIIHRIWDFGRTIQRLYESLASAEEMTEIFDTPHDILDKPKAKKLKVTKGGVIFEEASFCYHGTRKILDKFNLNIKAKEKIALVGPSGVGKSTIVKLILRSHDLDAGRILIDEQDIANVTQESLWSNVSYVPQDSILFHRNLRENIRYGKFDATDKEVEQAAKKAHCHEFIKNFSDGYNTFVGERGVKLSGGERQRVAIARAILRDAPILILDEATSSLDSQSEALIQDGLNNLMKNKTVIVVAHRLSTIMKMDRIVVIFDNQIAEIGSHQELLKKPEGIYRRLWNIQAGGFIK